MWNRMIYKTVKSDLLMGPKCFVQAKRYSRSILARDQFRIKGRITLVQDLINNYFQSTTPPTSLACMSSLRAPLFLPNRRYGVG